MRLLILSFCENRIQVKTLDQVFRVAFGVRGRDSVFQIDESAKVFRCVDRRAIDSCRAGFELLLVDGKHKNNIRDVEEVFDPFQELNGKVRAASVQFVNEDDKFRLLASHG